jgi:hypothetical protein
MIEPPAAVVDLKCTSQIGRCDRAFLDRRYEPEQATNARFFLCLHPRAPPLQPRTGCDDALAGAPYFVDIYRFEAARELVQETSSFRHPSQC